MNLTIIGAGYVGLITAVVFAHLGNKVWVVEIDKNKFEKLSKGEVPFYEQGIAELLQENLASGQIKFTSGYSTAIPEAEIIFICVGTPTKNGRADLTYVYTAAKEIAKNLRAPSIVVIKSTVPPGINHKIEAKMKKLTRVDFEIASVPEFLREGRALHDALHPHRVVIGTQNKKVAKKLLELHRKIPGKRIVCDPVSAQMIKYASNAFLPTKISFANSIAVWSDGLLLVTEWKAYQNLDFKRIKALMRSPVVLDGRNIYNRKQLEQLGFIYGGIGK